MLCPGKQKYATTAYHVILAGLSGDVRIMARLWSGNEKAVELGGGLVEYHS